MKNKEEQDNRNPRHRHWLLLQCQFWIYNILVFCLSFYVLSQIVYANRQVQAVYKTDENTYANEAVSMWKKGYIIDIVMVNTDNCPEAYQPVISYTWPGSIEGCYCQENSEEHDIEFILQGQCSSQLISDGCVKVSSISEQNLKMWKGGKLLCFKRTQSLSFYNSTLTQLDDGTALKTCAEGTDAQVTMINEVTCPISMFSNATVGSSQTSLQLDETNSLHFLSQLGYPIADFKLTEYQFCKFFPQRNISPDKNGNYLLEIINETQTCTGSDPRIVEVDSLTEQEYITNNTRIYDLISSLPSYPHPSISYTYKLGYIAYPDWTYSCRNTPEYTLSIATKHLQYTHITNATQLSLYVCIPCIVIVAILIRFLYIIRQIFQISAKRKYNMLVHTNEEIVEQIPNLNIVKTKTREIVYFVIEMLLILTILIILIVTVLELQQESSWIKQIFNRQCTSDHLNGIFRYYENQTDISYYILGKSLIFVCILIILEVSHFVIRNIFGDLKVKEQQKIEELSNEQLMKDNIYDKQIVMDDQFQLQDSSNLILNQEFEQTKQRKNINLDMFMNMDFNADETNVNFYAQQEHDTIPVGKKKKKKKLKMRSLMKDE